MITLQEALNYRPRCLIHNLPMVPGKVRGRVRGIKMMGDDLEIKLRHKVGPMAIQTLLFKADGTLTPPCPLINDKEGLTIYMSCPECWNVPITEHKLITTVQDVLQRNLLHRYTFRISGKEDRYFCDLEEETIKFHDEEKFYHIHVDLATGQSTFQMGHCHGDTLVQQLLDSVMNLQVPQFNPSSIQNIEQLVDKCKLYNLFS
jgi:hypothetical protein